MPDYRLIPSIEQLRQRQAVRALEHDFGRDAIVGALREAAAELRLVLHGAGGPGGQAPPADQEAAALFLERSARVRLAGASQPSLRPVINATGVVIHTNLGRAPLAPAALERIARAGAGYSNLEYDLAAGGRGARDVHAEALLCRLLGVEAALVVNNNAAATLLLLAALASGREVVVSRGELVEIGGGFRVPEVMEQSGAILREVGTTNKTRVADYAGAINERTALLLRVHRSNFRIEGFTEQPDLRELAALGRARGVPVAEDLGGGYVGVPGDEEHGRRLDDILGGEPKVQGTLAAGVDVCCFSGDKLLGGPQAGIIVGRRDLIRPIRRHPLMRALRVDKLTYAALEATLGEYVAGRAANTIPILRMILAPVEELERRGARLLAAVRTRATGPVPGGPMAPHSGSPQLDLAAGFSAIGGGTTPGLQIPTCLLTLSAAGATADELDARLRLHDPPIVARIDSDRVILDLRTVLPEQDETVAQALARLPEARSPKPEAS
jgi:L-seryl-tRNA(Ser) seleniumtransferase